MVKRALTIAAAAIRVIVPGEFSVNALESFPRKPLTVIVGYGADGGCIRSCGGIRRRLTQPPCDKRTWIAQSRNGQHPLVPKR